MSALHVRVLLDTGPTLDEIAGIERLFGTVDMTVGTEGHSYGGPPPTSAFLIVVNAPLTPFLDHLAIDRNDGATRLREVVDSLLGLRADPRRWGRPHPVKLEDAHTGLAVYLTADLPPVAYDQLLAADLSGIDCGTVPAYLTWHHRLGRWTVRLLNDSATIGRRVPGRTGRTTVFTTAQATESEVSRLWRLVDGTAESAVTWQRAAVVLRGLQGWSVESVAHHLMISPERTASIIRNYQRDGFASLEPRYSDGEAFQPSPAEQRDAELVAAHRPAEFGVDAPAWQEETLGEVLLAEGVVADVDPKWVGSLIDATGPGRESFHG